MSELPETRVSVAIDALLGRIGAAVSWIWPTLLVLVTASVVLRYAFGWGLVQLEEMQWHLYAIGFVLGLADCAAADAHVRIDVVHSRLSPATRAWIELYGLVLLLFPFLLLVILHGVPFVLRSFELGEISGAPGGLPHRFLIKAVLPLGFALLFLAAVSRLLRVTSALFGAPRPLARSRRS